MGHHFLESTIEQLEAQLKPKKATTLKSIVPNTKKNIIVKDLTQKIDKTNDNEKILKKPVENNTIKTKTREVVWLQ